MERPARLAVFARGSGTDVLKGRAPALCYPLGFSASARCVTAAEMAAFAWKCIDRLCEKGILTLQRSEASKLSRSFLSRLYGSGVSLLLVQEEVFQALCFARGSLAA